MAGGNTTHYVYGPGGALLGEYDGSGALIREYIHLNGEPLAQIDKSGGSEAILYLHTDHLLTARYATNAAGSTVWSWDSGAFGKEAPTGSATVNLRFPGQYYDAETGLHYNWHRYYDPTTGRYITSDPLGLAAGLNTYGYAAQNPLSFYDPDGRILPAALIPILAGLGTGLEILGTILAFPAGYYTTAAWINWYLGRGTVGQALCETAWNFGLPLAIGRIGRFLGAAANWLKGMGASVGDDVARFMGGRYGQIKGKIPGNEAHHMPADSVSPFPKSQGPAVSIPKKLHQETKSWGRSSDAKEWRRILKELMENGKFNDAQQMDIDDLRKVCRKAGCNMEDLEKAIEDMIKSNPSDIKL